MSSEDEVVVRFKVKDKAAFIADLKAGKIAVDDMQKSIVKADAEAKIKAGEMGGFSLLGKSAKFAALAVGGVTLALGAATVGVAAYGIKSASSLEQATIAYTTLLGSQSKANDLLDRLGAFAAKTPFQLQNLRQTGSAMLGAGFGENDIIPTLTAVGDAMSGLGRGQGDIDGVVQAFEKMRASVHLNAREMNELTVRGINGWQILADISGKSVEAVQKATSKRSIGSIAAINALVRGMEFGTKHTMKFGGLMEKQAGSLSGMWSNTIDAIQQATAKLMLPTFPTWKRMIGGFNNAMPAITSNLTTFGPKILSDVQHGGTKGGFGLAMDVGALLGGNFALTPVIEKAVVTVQNLVTIWRGSLWPAIKDLSVVLAPLVLLFTNLDSITGFLADHTTALRVVIKVVVGAIVAYKVAVLAMNLGIKAYIFWTELANIGTVSFTKATTVQRLAIIATTIATKAWQVLLGAFTFIQLAAQVRSFSDAMALLDLAMDANPIGLVVLAIAAIGVAFYLAYTKSKTFRDFINGLWTDMKGFYNWLNTVWNPTKWGGPVANIPPSSVGGADIPAINGGSSTAPGPLIMPGGMADGGRVQRPGWSRIGERGPELMHMPRGASVIPLPRVPEFAGRDTGDIVVQIDGREVFRAVRRHEDDGLARL